MQTPKASKKSSSETPKKISPQAVRQLKPTTLQTARASSSNLATRTPSPKVVARGSPQSPASEKKRPSKISGLESQISQLQEELKNMKDQLSYAESWKIEAKKKEEEFKEQLLASSLELKESQNKISELSLSEETHKTNLEKISEDREKELQKAESTELELKSLREKMDETLSLVEETNEQLSACKESESQAQVVVGETLSQLEIAKKTVETLQLEIVNAEKAHSSIASELVWSRANENLLEELVKKLKTTSEYFNIENQQSEKINQFEAELGSVRNELDVVKTALKFAEIKNNEERNNSTLLITSLTETAEQIRSSFSVREAELEAELSKAKADIEEMKANLMDKENELQSRFEVEKEMTVLRQEIEMLKGNLMDKETESQNISEENKELKLEMKRRETEDGEMEREREERERKAERVAEQLEAVQAVNGEMEAELRRIKVQSNQWRKAAEVAAAMVSPGNTGKYVERTGSLDSRPGSPYRGDIDDDELLKKKNGNVLKKIGVLWKKPQK